MLFDWIDFGVSWNAPTTIQFDKHLHSSTSSAVSQRLRRREAPFRKVFCWLSATALPTSNTANVRHIEALFPQSGYEQADRKGKLEMFATWLVQALRSGAPELAISQSEQIEILRTLRDTEYLYVLDARARGDVEAEPCKVRYSHGPGALTVHVERGRGPNRQSRTLMDAFPPDELIYRHGVIGCLPAADGLAVKTFRGWI